MTAPLNNGFRSERLERVFADCFAAKLHTRLQGGADEPLYQPALQEGGWHVLYYRADYFASALHEVAHWCIAGAARRQRVDFGYWYVPDGRNDARQQAFEAVESKPQALEWYFAKASGYRFRVSVDNMERVSGEVLAMSDFPREVYEQALGWQREGLPGRAEEFFHSLCREFDTPASPRELHFDLAELN
ncbi:MAG: transporting ATPase [Gammaproteobacteria bacterium]|nr:MAG: transporting ATPase [Gammaproteobacteria bacterium]RLA59866.1 MAG: transporting ATPase [Gammaproteobacteria bacterium]